MPTYHEDPPRGLLSVTPTSAGESLRRLASTTRGLSGINVAPGTLGAGGVARFARTHALVPHTRTVVLQSMESIAGDVRLLETGGDLVNRVIHYADVSAVHFPGIAVPRATYLLYWMMCIPQRARLVEPARFSLTAILSNGDEVTVATLDFSDAAVPVNVVDGFAGEQVRQVVRVDRDLISTDTHDLRVYVDALTRRDDVGHTPSLVIVSQLGLLYRGAA